MAGLAGGARRFVQGRCAGKYWARPAASESKRGLCKATEVGEWTSALETGTKRRAESSQEALLGNSAC